MSFPVIGLIGLVVMMVFMFIGLPIYVSMGLTGLLGYAALRGVHLALAMAGGLPWSTLADFTMAVLPLFILMGEFASASGMMTDAYRAANTWIGNLPGGLASASIVGACLFSCVSGSSMACAAMMTEVAYPALTALNYDKRLAVGALAAGGTLGSLVPPGLAYVFYSMMSEVSLGDLYIASIIPGFVLTTMYVLQIYIQCKINPKAGPPAGASTFKQKAIAFKWAWPLIALFAVVMGGIWFGVFLPSEAAAIGCLGAIVYALAKRSVNRKTMGQSFKSTLRICGMAFACVTGAFLFTRFIAISRLPTMLADWVVGLGLSRVGVIVCIMLIYFILGTAMDTISMMLLTLPILIPLVNSMGIDLVWFGVLCVIQMELSAITPPTGMNMFVVAGMLKDKGVTMMDVFRGVIPFCVTMVIFNIGLIIWPQIAMYLVHTMRTM